jgi:hypothetical protein
MNSDFVTARSQALAQLILREMSVDSKPQPISQRVRVTQWITLAFQKCLSRYPDETEAKLASEYIIDALKANPSEDAESRVLANFCQAIFASGEFRNAD